MDILETLREHAEMVCAVVATLGCGLAVAVAVLLQQAHERRMDLLEQADKILLRCCHEAERVVENEATPAAVVELVRRCIASSLTRDGALHMKGVLEADRIRFTDEQKKYIAALHADLEQLGRHNPELLAAANYVSRGTLLATLLRWPDTEALGIARLPSLRPKKQAAEIREIEELAVPAFFHEPIAA